MIEWNPRNTLGVGIILAVVAAIAFNTFVLAEAQLDGEYIVGKDEIKIYVNESSPRYDFVLTHEKAHRVLATSVPAFEWLYQFFRVVGLLFAVVAYWYWRPDFAALSVGFLHMPTAVVETHAYLVELTTHYLQAPVLGSTVAPVLAILVYTGLPVYVAVWLYDYIKFSQEAVRSRGGE